MLNRPSNEILANMAKKGDIKAFEELFERFKRPILNFIYQLIGNRETAEEVTQEVFMKVYNHLDIFDPERKFTSWIYIIARNLAKNALRDRKYFRDISLEKKVSERDKAIRLQDVIRDPSASPEAIAEERELAEIAQEILNSLPLKYTEVIALCSTQGLTYKEAAEIIGCSASSVGIRLDKARVMFMEKLNARIKNRGSDKR